jgi:hypothetical protein
MDMDSTTIRRYLQPSPTLRWHPWAPLVAGILLLVFVFYLGTRWGFSASQRVFNGFYVTAGASDVLLRDKLREKSAVSAMERDAARLDALVSEYLHRQSHPQTALQQWRDRIEHYVFFNGFGMPGLTRAQVAEIAEFRLAAYSAANPQWQVSSTWCDEMSAFSRSRYHRGADEYTQLLGRTIRPEDLAPAVSGGKCSF